MMFDMNMNCSSWLVSPWFYAMCYGHMIGWISSVPIKVTDRYTVWPNQHYGWKGEKKNIPNIPMVLKSSLPYRFAFLTGSLFSLLHLLFILSLSIFSLSSHSSSCVVFLFPSPSPVRYHWWQFLPRYPVIYWFLMRFFFGIHPHKHTHIHQHHHHHPPIPAILTSTSTQNVARQQSCVRPGTALWKCPDEESCLYTHTEEILRSKNHLEPICRSPSHTITM